jgi:GGDEF domain-containing protein
MEIDIHSTRRLQDVFMKYSDPETFVFDRTHILVDLSRSNEERFISRSQAKRVLTNLDKFKHIILDFKGVHTVGQAFVDEVFRVYKNQHPDITIDVTNASDDIQFMINRGIATAKDGTPG